MVQFSMNTEDTRHVYYIFRAMHDATCPSCGHSADSFESKCGRDGLECPICYFRLNAAEIRGIEALVPQVLRIRLEALGRCREELRENG